MTPFIKKTVIMFDENNCLVYLGAYLFKEKGKEYMKEKLYMKEFIDQYWKTYHKKPSSLRSAEKIKILKEVFGITDLEIL